jgi:DNA-binding winged helix-turn-helix (wHTH) protein
LIRFGVFEANLETGELRKRGVRIKIQEQPLQILAMLLERRGQVVTRDELHKTLWGAHTFVDFERGLNKAINRLREALEDSAENPRFIETFPKRGYRFIAPVCATTSNPEEPVIAVNYDRRDATLQSRLLRSSLLHRRMSLSSHMGSRSLLMPDAWHSSPRITKGKVRFGSGTFLE